MNLDNKINEEKQFKARIAFMGEPRDNARDMRAAGRMKMYDTATERDVPSKRKSTVFDITFKSERQFSQFMGAYDVEFLDRLDEATKKQNGEKARKVLTSAKVPHDMVMGTIRVPERFVRIAKEKLDDAFGGMFQKKTGFKVSGTMKESRDDFDYLDAQAASEDRAIAGKKFMDALKKAGIKAEYVRSSGTMRVAKKDLRKAQGIGKKLKVDRDGVRMDVLREDVQLDEKVMTFTFRKTEDAREFESKAFSLANSTDIMMMPGGKTGVEVSTMGPKDDKRLISLAKKMGGRVHKIVEDVQLDEKKKPISTRLGDAFDSGELEDRIKSMSGPARKSFMNLANSLTDFYHSMGDIHQVDGRQLEDKIDGSPPRVRKMFAKLLDEDVQIDEVTGETTVMAKSDRNQYERITRALTAANRTGKIKGYEGAHFNERTGMLTLIFDSKAHKPASERRKVAKMIKDFGLEFSHSVEEGLRQAMSKPKETQG